MIQFTEEQDKAAREWNEAFDYRALRNGVQCGNILMLHLDEVNKRAMELYAAQQVAAEREKIKKVIIKSKNEHYQDFLDDTTDKHAYGKYRACENILELIDSL